MTEQEKQIWEEWWRSQNALTLYNYLTGAEEPWLPDISYWVNDKVGDFRIHIARFDVPECDFEIFDYTMGETEISPQNVMIELSTCRSERRQTWKIETFDRKLQSLCVFGGHEKASSNPIQIPPWNTLEQEHIFFEEETLPMWDKTDLLWQMAMQECGHLS